MTFVNWEDATLERSDAEKNYNFNTSCTIDARYTIDFSQLNTVVGLVGFTGNVHLVGLKVGMTRTFAKNSVSCLEDFFEGIFNK